MPVKFSDGQAKFSEQGRTLLPSKFLIMRNKIISKLRFEKKGEKSI